MRYTNRHFTYLLTSISPKFFCGTNADLFMGANFIVAESTVCNGMLAHLSDIIPDSVHRQIHKCQLQ